MPQYDTVKPTRLFSFAARRSERHTAAVATALDMQTEQARVWQDAAAAAARMLTASAAEFVVILAREAPPLMFRTPCRILRRGLAYTRRMGRR